MSNARAIQRIRAGFREIAAALEELLDAEEWIDQKASPLGRRQHCAAARSGRLRAKLVNRRWLARRADIDAYIEKYGTARPPAERPEADDATAIAEILEFRAPRHRRKGVETP